MSKSYKKREMKNAQNFDLQAMGTRSGEGPHVSKSDRRKSNKKNRWETEHDYED